MIQTANLPGPSDVQSNLADAELFLSVILSIREAKQSPFQAASDSFQGFASIPDPLSDPPRATTPEGQISVSYRTLPLTDTSSPPIAPSRKVIKVQGNRSPTKTSMLVRRTRTGHHRKAKDATRSRVQAMCKNTRTRQRKKNRTEAERIGELEQDCLIGEFEPHAAFCLLCKAWVALDKRNRYYIGLWDKHKTNYHTPGGKSYEMEGRMGNDLGQKVKLFTSRRSKKNLISVPRLLA